MKCVIVMDQDESGKNITCGRDVKVKYKSIIKLDGKKVVEEEWAFGVCSRHIYIMEETLNEHKTNS